MSRKILHRGVVVQGYQIDRVLGQGGFGITYLATELANMSYVAIKEYFPKSFASRNTGNTIRPITGNENQRIFSIGLKGFLEEARVLARLDHPNVIKVKSILFLKIDNFTKWRIISKSITESKNAIRIKPFCFSY